MLLSQCQPLVFLCLSLLVLLQNSHSQPATSILVGGVLLRCSSIDNLFRKDALEVLLTQYRLQATSSSPRPCFPPSLFHQSLNLEPVADKLELGVHALFAFMHHARQTRCIWI